MSERESVRNSEGSPAAEQHAGEKQNIFLEVLKDEFFSRARCWVLLFLTVLFLAGSSIWEFHLHNSGYTVAGIFPLFNAFAWAGFVQELGFACFIALFILLGVEGFARAQHEAIAQQQLERFTDQSRIFHAGVSEEFERRTDRIVKSVFCGVCASNMNQRVIDEVIEHILLSQVLRCGHQNTYTLNDKTVTVEDEKISFIELQADSNYTVKNLSKTAEVEFPVRINFPIPADKRLIGSTGIEGVCFDGDWLEADELREGDEAVPNTEYQHCYRWIRIIPPEGTLEVRSRYMLVKERSDTELWLSLIPGLSMDLTMHISANGLEFGVKEIHRMEATKIAGTGYTGLHRWEIKAPILPNQGILVWWRPRTPDRVAAAAES